MSTAQALQTVTTALLNRLAKTVTGGKVHARPPDRVKAGLETDAFLNLFLFEVLPNSAWRNQEYPSRGGASTLRPPLALDLRYLLTAYPNGDEEQTAHGLLGAAMLTLHDNPVLGRAELIDAMDQNAVPRPPQTAIDLQLDQVKLSQVHLPLDELSRLWTAFATDYRLSVVYRVAVVLIDSGQPSAAPLPVLQRGSRDPATDEPPYIIAGAGPVLEDLYVESWRGNQSFPARHKDRIVLSGRRLNAGSAFVRFYHPDLPNPLQAAPVAASGEQLVAVLPATLPLGFASVAAGFDLNGVVITTNRVPLGVAPRIIAVTKGAVSAGRIVLTVAVAPPPPVKTPVMLLFAGAQVTGTRTSPGTYRFAAPLPAGASAAHPVSVPLRVRIEGIDSIPLPDPVAGQPLPLDWDPAQVVRVP